LARRYILIYMLQGQPALSGSRCIVAGCREIAARTKLYHSGLCVGKRASHSCFDQRAHTLNPAIALGLICAFFCRRRFALFAAVRGAFCRCLVRNVDLYYHVFRCFFFAPFIGCAALQALSRTFFGEGFGRVGHVGKGGSPDIVRLGLKIARF